MKIMKKENFIWIKLNKKERKSFDKVAAKLPNNTSYVIASALHANVFKTIGFGEDGLPGANLEACQTGDDYDIDFQFTTDITKMPMPGIVAFYVASIVIKYGLRMITRKSYETKLKRVIRTLKKMYSKTYHTVLICGWYPLPQQLEKFLEVDFKF